MTFRGVATTIKIDKRFLFIRSPYRIYQRGCVEFHVVAFNSSFPVRNDTPPLVLSVRVFYFINFMSNSINSFVRGESTGRYYPSLKIMAGSVEATVLFFKLLFLCVEGGGVFCRSNNPLDPENYEPSKLWLDVMGLSKSEFNSALNKIATEVGENGEVVRKGGQLVFYSKFNGMTRFWLNEESVENGLSKILAAEKKSANVNI